MAIATASLDIGLRHGRARCERAGPFAVGGAGCLCYLPTVLAHRLGEYDKAGVEVELVNFKGGSQALTAVLGGRKNVVDPNSVAVIGIGLDATAVAAQEQGMVDAAVMLDPSVTLLQGKYAHAWGKR